MIARSPPPLLTSRTLCDLRPLVCAASTTMRELLGGRRVQGDDIVSRVHHTTPRRTASAAATTATYRSNYCEKSILIGRARAPSSPDVRFFSAPYIVLRCAIKRTNNIFIIIIIRYCYNNHNHYYFFLFGRRVYAYARVQ